MQFVYVADQVGLLIAVRFVVVAMDQNDFSVLDGQVTPLAQSD
jgi:hypothetical protein